VQGPVAAYGPPVASDARSFVIRHSRLRPVPGLEAIRLHLADEILPLWRAVQVATGDPDAPLPYWAFAWAGGLALAHHLAANPDLVCGRRVFDLGTGSGLVAIAAARAGADAVTGADIDPFAVAATRLNARSNGVRLDLIGRDMLDEPPPEVDIVLAGDCWYEGGLGERATGWLRRAASGGRTVLLGDPGRRYLPADLHRIAAYEVRTTTELEDLAQKTAGVYAFG
jgi:predicted nicotinamide N-methyase